MAKFLVKTVQKTINSLTSHLEKNKTMATFFDKNQLKLRGNFTCIIHGGTGTGKSTLTQKIINNAKNLIDPPVLSTIYAYGQVSENVKDLESRPDVVTVPGCPDIEMLKNTESPFLVTLDDLMLSAKPDYLADLFSVQSHHLGFSIIFITHNLFAPSLRVPRQSCHYLILLKAVNSKLQVKCLGSQLFPGSKGFMQAVEDAWSEDYGYIFIDSHPKTPSDLRLRT